MYCGCTRYLRGWSWYDVPYCCTDQRVDRAVFSGRCGHAEFCHSVCVPPALPAYCALVGAVGWLWYELLTLLGADAATASLLAVIPLTILTRVFAITQKTPVTVFLLTGIFPLVPGAGIYYTAYYFIQNENTLALAKGISTFKIAVALAIGISLVLCVPLPKKRK